MMNWLFRALSCPVDRRRSRSSREKLLRMEWLEERATPASLVAAYSFNEGTGGTVGDTSGHVNTGTIGNATWSTSGKYGNALSFNGTSAMVTISDAPSLDLTTGMTLEAWVNPSNVSGGWRDVIYKGDDNYYLLAATPSGPPATGGTFTGTLYGSSTLALNTWSHLAATYNGAMLRLYVNGVEVASGPQAGLIQTSTGPLSIGGDPLFGQFFAGWIDELRIYDGALTAAQIQADMNTPIGDPPVDTQPPTISLTAPSASATLSHVAIISATATDDLGVVLVEFYVDGTSVGFDGVAPYSLNWDSTTSTTGPHVITAVARDVGGNETTSDPVNVTTMNPAFINEVVVPDILDATTIAFLPDGRILVGELSNKILVVQPGANQPDSQPFLDLDYTFLGGEQGLFDIAVDPDFSQNGYFYVFYTKGFPDQQNFNRLSRFTAIGNGVVPGSELVLYQDESAAGVEHHGGAVVFGTDGKIYFTTGEHFLPSLSQQLDNTRGKILRINPDGSIPLDNPFYDGAGPNKDAIWAYGLRNPFRMSIDPVTGRMFIGDVGSNSAFAIEEINLGARGANYGWPLGEGDSGIPGTTAPIFSYSHNGRDAAVMGGFVYRGSQFPSEYYGSYFFGDYAQHTIRRLTFDAQGDIANIVDFWPADGSLDQPLPGDVVKMIEGPDGSLYYVDLGFDGYYNPNPAAIRRIRYVATNLPPIVAVSADPTSGLPPLTVEFSSVGTFDPEGLGLAFAWDFGDGSVSTDANPTHTYATPGPYVATLTVSDGVNSTLSNSLEISVGTSPTPTILGPSDGSLFRAGDAIAFSGIATDAEDDDLPASAFRWEIRFHHEGHIHPAGVLTNTMSGALNIPTSGHDFQGATSYEIVLTVTDSTGLTGTTSVTVNPEKVNLSFDSFPSGLTVSIDGINRQTPFVLDDLIGFQHTITAPDQTGGGVDYTFLGWTDGGAQSHVIVVPSTDQSYLAAFAETSTYLPGDYNADQTVNAADYAVWRDQLGSSVILPNDTTPGMVTQVDYDLWKANFGETVPASGEAAVGGATAGNVVITSVVPTGPADATATAVNSTAGGKQVASRWADFVILNRSQSPSSRSRGSRELSLFRETWDALLLTRPRPSDDTGNGETRAPGATIARHAESQFDDPFLAALDSIFAESEQIWVSRLV